MKVILSRGRIKKKHRFSVCVHTRHYFTLISTYMSRCPVLTHEFFCPKRHISPGAQS